MNSERRQAKQLFSRDPRDYLHTSLQLLIGEATIFNRSIDGQTKGSEPSSNIHALPSYTL